MQEFYVQSVIEFIRKNLDVHLSLKEDRDIIKSQRKLQHYFSVRPFEGSEKSFFENILSHAALAEKSSPGAGLLFLREVVDPKQSLKKSHDHGVKSKNDIVEMIHLSRFDSMITHMLIEALYMSTAHTTYVIKRSPNSSSSVEYVEGYKFKAQRLFHHIDAKLTDAKIVCIDGYVESVSEIHHLLQKLFETQDDCLMFCRGMSEDVKHTLKVNVDRRSLNIIPYLVPFDLESCNTLVDIAVVSGCDVISTTKGQTMSSICYELLGSVSRCESSRDSVVMYDKKNKKNVLLHVSNINKKLEEREEVGSFLADRIRSLTSSCVEFRIPDDLNYNSRCQQLDEGIRIISSFAGKRETSEQVVESLIKSYNSIKSDLVFTSEEK